MGKGGGGKFAKEKEKNKLLQPFGQIEADKMFVVCSHVELMHV